MGDDEKPLHYFVNQAEAQVKDTVRATLMNLRPHNQELVKLTREVMYLDELKFESKTLDRIFEWLSTKWTNATDEEKKPTYFGHEINAFNWNNAYGTN